MSDLTRVLGDLYGAGHADPIGTTPPNQTDDGLRWADEALFEDSLADWHVVRAGEGGHDAAPLGRNPEATAALSGAVTVAGPASLPAEAGEADGAVPADDWTVPADNWAVPGPDRAPGDADRAAAGGADRAEVASAQPAGRAAPAPTPVRLWQPADDDILPSRRRRRLRRG